MYIEANVSIEDIASCASSCTEDARQVILCITENFTQDFTIDTTRTLLQCLFDEGYFKDVLAIADEFRGKVEEFHAQ